MRPRTVRVQERTPVPIVVIPLDKIMRIDSSNPNKAKSLKLKFTIF